MPRPSLRVALIALLFVASTPLTSHAQAVVGTCTSCGGPSTDHNCGNCVADATGASGGRRCFDTLPPSEQRPGVFTTSDGHDARSLTFAHLVRGAPMSATDINRAVNRAYNGNNVWLYYGTGAPAGYCSPPGGPRPAFADSTMYHFGYDHRFEDTLDSLDCYNAEVDRYYLGVAGQPDGTRVCDGEQSQFIPSEGAIFDLGGDGNRVAVFPYTDHPPLPCESFEYSVWLSDNPDATDVADSAHPDPMKWNPAVLIRAFLQGWIPDSPVPTDPLNPDLSNPTQHDGLVQVFALPCGLTFRYASVVAGNNGNPSSACQFWSFDAELDAVAGLNENDTAICPDADGDGYRDAACGGNDCNDMDPAVHPGALETCSSGRDLNCDGVATMCPSSTFCFQSQCVPQCLEGACATGFTCVSGDAGANFCVPSACVGVSCPAGQVCGPAGCQDPCQAAVCPPGQFCRGGACLDPCLGAACPTHQHCEADAMGNGHCVVDCSCLPCSAGLTCNGMTGRCATAACASASCAPGQILDCSSGSPVCRSGCDGVVCPLGQLCDPTSANCVRDACFGVACQPGLHCSGGSCVADARPDAGMDSGGGDASSGDANRDAVARGDTQIDGRGSDGSTTQNNHAGCGCKVPARPRGSVAAAWIALGLVLASRRRQRTKR